MATLHLLLHEGRHPTRSVDVKTNSVDCALHLALDELRRVTATVAQISAAADIVARGLITRSATERKVSTKLELAASILNHELRRRELYCNAVVTWPAYAGSRPPV